MELILTFIKYVDWKMTKSTLSRKLNLITWVKKKERMQLMKSEYWHLSRIQMSFRIKKLFLMKKVKVYGKLDIFIFA